MKVQVLNTPHSIAWQLFKLPEAPVNQALGRLGVVLKWDAPYPLRIVEFHWTDETFQIRVQRL
jgi:hypothetical protein